MRWGSRVGCGRSPILYRPHPNTLCRGGGGIRNFPFPPRNSGKIPTRKGGSENTGNCRSRGGGVVDTGIILPSANARSVKISLSCEKKAAVFLTNFSQWIWDAANSLNCKTPIGCLKPPDGVATSEGRKEGRRDSHRDTGSCEARGLWISSEGRYTPRGSDTGNSLGPITQGRKQLQIPKKTICKFLWDFPQWRRGVRFF